MVGGHPWAVEVVSEERLVQASRLRGDRTSGRGGTWVATLAVAVLTAFALLAVAIESPVGAQTSDTGYQKKNSPLDTPWTAKVGPKNALPEYPRPQMKRERWQNLNGVWQFNGASEGEDPPFGRELPERVLVPYPIESALSGIKRHEDRMFYRRTFTVPDEWNVGSGKRLKLHFGAVDYETTVWVNGQQVGAHKGGYDEFTFDVTNELKNRGKQEIVVGVTDLTDRGNRPFERPYRGSSQPTGKQTLRPGGIFYTAASGIWQTVWMEPVSEANITELDMTPDIDDESLAVTVNAENAEGNTVKVTAINPKTGDRVGSVKGVPNTELRLPVPTPKLWSPKNPYLYDMRVRLLDGRRAVDSVGSYFGMREVGVAEGSDGKPRMMLNGKFVANMGTLDQGYWPDGVYTAPTDAGLKFDLVQHKKLGYNMVRKHIKVEPDRWFYHADKLGLLVWQDMPSFSPVYDPNPADQAQFEEELRQIVDEHDHITSVTTWVPYNEGWGEIDQPTTARVAEMVKEQDPSRMVNAHSGVNCCESQGDSGAGDIYDQHNYQDPPLPVPFDDRATVAGEYGGVALRMPEHEYDPSISFAPYGAEPTPERLTERYEELQDKMKQGVASCGVSAGVYTEITDLEGEVNGMWTYDRQVFKPGEDNRDRIVAANEGVIAASKTASFRDLDLPPGTEGPNGVLYYPFSEGGDATTTEDEGDDATDTDGTLVNGPTWTTGSPNSPTPDSGLHFDGQDDFVDAGAPVVDTAGNYTVTAWVRFDDLDGYQTVVSQNSTNPASAFFLQYHDGNDRLQFAFPQGAVRSDAPPVAGQWYHMVGVRDAEEGTYKLYVDGVLQDTTGQCLADGSTGNLVVGRAQFNNIPVDFTDGNIDQVHAYDRALTDEEVSQLFASGR